MPTPHPISEARPLCYFIDHLAELPRWSWLYVSADETAITLDTPCRPAARDSREMSEEEIQEFEAYCERIGLRSFFNRDQLRDIIGNLRQQRSDFTSQELVAAVNFYWRCDAFIDLSRSGAQP